MKPQDLAFIVVILILLYKHNPRYFVIAGLSMFAAAIPLFAKWIFFTAERLTWYGSLCMLIAVLLFLIEERRKTS